MRYDTGRHCGSFLVIAALLAGCGAPSTAAPSPTALPIEQGLYVSGYKTPEGFYITVDDSPDIASACRGATDVFFYDGANTGEIGSDESGHWTNAAVRISRVGPARKPLDAALARASRGYTLVWDAEGERSASPALALKATGPGQFTHLGMGSFGESNYQKCTFAQLSPKMQAVVRAEQPQMARAAAPQPSAGAQAAGASDEDAVRAIVGSIYGWRDGRQVDMMHDRIALFSPRLSGLLAQCEAAAENADSQANGGEGPYAVLGDQGCINVPFLTHPMTDDPAPFIPKARPILRRTGPDTIDVDIAVAPADRDDWWEDTLGQTIRFQRSGGRWLVDETLTRTTGGTQLYSSHLQQSIVELRKIAKKPRRR